MTQQAHFWIYITQKNRKWGLEGHIYAALFMIPKSREVQPPRCPSTGEWICQSWCLLKTELSFREERLKGRQGRLCAK